MMSQDDRLRAMFQSAHLPPKLREVSQPFGDLADRLFEVVPGSPERTLALRAPWEAKNLAVMAVILARMDDEASDGDTDDATTKENPPAQR